MTSQFHKPKILLRNSASDAFAVLSVRFGVAGTQKKLGRSEACLRKRAHRIPETAMALRQNFYIRLENCYHEAMRRTLPWSWADLMILRPRRLLQIVLLRRNTSVALRVLSGSYKAARRIETISSCKSYFVKQKMEF